MTAIDSAASAAAAGLTVGSASASAPQLWDERARLRAVSVRPSRSLIWLARMMTAMPAVKPTVTG